MRNIAFLLAAGLGAAVIGAAPAQADPVTPTPVADLSGCTAGPVLCTISGALVDITGVLVGNTMAVITYGLCFGPVQPGHGSIIPPVVYDFRPWCPRPPA